MKTAWNAALVRLAIDRVLVHDLRRTALTNMDEAGIQRNVAMAISGHKTESVYRRYLIGNKKKVVAAGKTMEAFLEQIDQKAQQERANRQQPHNVLGRVQ